MVLTTNRVRSNWRVSEDIESGQSVNENLPVSLGSYSREGVKRTVFVIDETKISATPAKFLPNESVCPLCSNERLTRKFPGVLDWVAQCESCKLVFASPQPTDDELQAIYDEHYYEQFGFIEDWSMSKDSSGLEPVKRATYARMLSASEPFVHTSGRRLLDVGCGLGYSLLEATARGWDARGLDPLAPEDPSRRPGRTILRGALETFETEKPFDLVSMIDVIEHVRDPVATIKHAAELMAPGGALLLATNDISSLGARVLGPRWTHLHRAHLWFFTPDTLSAAVKAAGLEVRATVHAERVYNLQYVASILARGTNFDLARKASALALKIVPERVRAMSWPALPEGFIVIAQRPTAR